MMYFCYISCFVFSCVPLGICVYFSVFLADRTNGRAYATVLRLSVVRL